MLVCCLGTQCVSEVFYFRDTVKLHSVDVLVLFSMDSTVYSSLIRPVSLEQLHVPVHFFVTRVSFTVS